MKKPRLVLVADNFLPRWDGVARFLIELIPGLTQHFRVCVIAPKFPGKFKAPKSIEMHRFDVMKRDFGDIQFSKPNYKKVKEIIRDSDVVFVQSIGPLGMSAIYAASKLKIPALFYVHSIDWELTSNSVKRFKTITRILTRILDWYFFRKVKVLIAPSQDVKSIISKLWIKTRIEVAKLGINTGLFTPPESKEEAKRKIGIDPSNHVIGFYGRVSREKSIETLVDAFKRVRQEIPNCTLLVVGDGVPELLDTLSNEEGVILTGSTNIGQAYLQAMDVYVLPSLTETTSLTTLEALSCGLPVISTKVGRIKEYIKERQNGLFIPKNNPIVLSIKLQRLLNNPEEGRALGKAGRETVLKHFQWSETQEKITKLLKQYALKSSD